MYFPEEPHGKEGQWIMHKTWRIPMPLTFTDEMDKETLMLPPGFENIQLTTAGHITCASDFLNWNRASQLFPSVDCCRYEAQEQLVAIVSHFVEKNDVDDEIGCHPEEKVQICREFLWKFIWVKTAYAWRQNLTRLRSMLLRVAICSCFYAFWIKEDTWGLHTYGRKQDRDWIMRQ